MTNNSGETPSNNQNHETKGFSLEPRALHFDQDGPAVSGKIYANNMDMQEVHDALVNDVGIDPSDILLSDKDGKTIGNRNMSRAAFTGAWNSSWETEADRKKRENARLN